ncbi:hypothetical protein W97_04300 [Coniosporium apollinis CBS 100218]|uniref:T6SS Phospholipase effector Tle1-like catalytic domain-containing protein n=1 Tax=Coniosporium apollinis (strain CBS 100218) TaxID=1168221 RepID=R7YT51_CONA1|nr:uncharacterized protein W97_04300 [Coniosporium apollinis CBS 100218]EON65065.1 hypothetical protein W97_04300 [Coniosporium apollinis CBS 100218]
MSTAVSGSTAIEPKRLSHFRKRLIILCDGTGQDSTANDLKYPTNVTRFARAISPWTEVETAGEGKVQVEQIVYYQKGVGTNSKLDWGLGGATGAGVAANIRAAYGFLAHNYDPDDEIYFFGYSRGAYTARAIAGMVTEVGLLTKRGMDAFPTLYEAHHKRRLSGSKKGTSNDSPIEGIDSNWYHKGAEDSVRIIGVWDTVAFHKPEVGELLGYDVEDFEFENLELSPKIQYGFHALALDERRTVFSPTLWGLSPQDSRTDRMKQVWFSGRHSDIGGGGSDPRLSDITLAWMIAECEKTKLLSFDHSYCVSDYEKLDPNESEPWNTTLGTTEDPGTRDLLDLVYHWADVIPFMNTVDDRRPMSLDGTTNEQIHKSIVDRKLAQNLDGEDCVIYPCKLLTGTHDATGWQLQWDAGKYLMEAEIQDVEMKYKGRVRNAKSSG